MSSVYWEEKWKEKFRERKAKIKANPKIDYWDKRAKDFSKMRKSNDYDFGRKVQQALNDIITPESSVLDIGAGPGSFVIPFAKKAKWVTALEPSKEMIKILQENAKEKEISNFDIIENVLEDVPSESIKDKYDLVTVSLVLWMFEDVWPEILKMEEISKKYCAIIASIPTDGKSYDKIKESIGVRKNKVNFDEFQVLFNLLFTKGRCPNVTMIDYRCERSIEDEISCQKIMTEEYDEKVTPEIEEKIREAVEKNAIDGKCLVSSKSAVIWWNKENII
ncbi:class I SAM-dependent methyltransferase [Terrisporobacter glycolicus]|uniref:class I SAM-dependent methyltransferase n=1 Tax=Terrisporobacter glycolicus TaxID=36841 RepID=UPI000A755601